MFFHKSVAGKHPVTTSKTTTTTTFLPISSHSKSVMAFTECLIPETSSLVESAGLGIYPKKIGIFNINFE